MKRRRQPPSRYGRRPPRITCIDPRANEKVQADADRRGVYPSWWIASLVNAYYGYSTPPFPKR